ncbi:LysR family transcriptional regulator [Ramlibacter sp. AW1]|uniref:LysR family transcriptional regulator n=1 Tax=Ramlibacter aurantiacus TaxID=2801330 RepID=A0A936ZY95_9BURK|nr:LysR family transcriptional regulator [Ramlibacter aurantiacus]MBL0422684.1 LysR family transcriptional regulator [Ramlibacter aurantiacus]
MNPKHLPTVRQLQAFLAVYRLRKLGAAAAQLFITPSAVSVLIRQLEDGLGVRLFDRTTRSLQPTPAAHETLPIAERVLGDLDGLATGLRELSELQRGEVSLVMTPTLASMLLPPVVEAFATRHPGVRLRVTDCAPDQFLPRIVGGMVDLGIGTPEQAGGEVEQRTLLRDRMALVCRRDHPLAAARRVRWADLEGIAVIAGRPGYGVRQLVDVAAAQAGAVLRVSHEISFQSTALWMVASGLGPAVMPSAYARHAADARLVIKPLSQPVVRRDIHIVTRRDRHLSPAGRAFIDVLRETWPMGPDRP